MATNSNAPRGLKPVGGGTSGIASNSKWYDMDATIGAFGIGQPMARLTGGKVTRWTSGECLGSAAVIKWTASDGTPQEDKFWPGNVTGATNVKVKVYHDPNQFFEIQCDGEFEEADLGKNANFTAPSSSTSLKVSTVALDISSAATTATLPFRILEVVGVTFDGSEVGNYTKVIGKINNHALNEGAGL